jgi:hypothetical protein
VVFGMAAVIAMLKGFQNSNTLAAHGTKIDHVTTLANATLTAAKDELAQSNVEKGELREEIGKLKEQQEK